MEVGEVSLPQEEEVVGVFPLVEIVLPSGMVELGHFLIELANTWTGVAFELEAGAEKISIKGLGQYLKKGCEIHNLKKKKEYRKTH